MRRIKFRGGIIIAILILTGCKSLEEKIAEAERPSVVVLKFYEALQKQDREQARMCMTTKYMGRTVRLVPSIGEAALGVVIIAEELLAKDSHYQVLSEQIMGDKAVVKVERTFTPKKTKMEKDVYLCFVKDGWYIVRIGGSPPWESQQK